MPPPGRAAAHVAWWELPETAAYLWAHLVRHLVGAGRASEVLALVTDLRWVAAKLDRSQLGPVAVEADLALAQAVSSGGEVSSGGAALSALRRVLVQAAHLLGPLDPPPALAAVLLSRLDGVPELAGARERFAATVEPPLLVNRWRPPDQPHPALLRAFAGHHRWVNGLAVSPDGTWLASAGRDGTVRIWDVAAGRARVVLVGHRGRVDACTVAPDGSWIASAGTDGTVRIWDMPEHDTAGDSSDLAPRMTLEGHEGAVHACVALPLPLPRATVPADGAGAGGSVAAGAAGRGRGDGGGDGGDGGGGDGGGGGGGGPGGSTGGAVVSGGADGTVQVWDAVSGEPVLVVGLHSGPVNCLAVVPGAPAVACGTGDGTVLVVDLSQRRRDHGAAAPPEAEVSLAQRRSDHDLRRRRRDDFPAPPEADVPGSLAGCGAIRATFTGHRGPVLGVAVSPDGAFVASAGQDGTVRMWDCRTRRALAVVGAGDRMMRDCAITPDGRLISTGWDGIARIWDVASGRKLAELTGPSGGTHACVVSPDGTWLATAGRYGVIRIWNLRSDAETGPVGGRDESMRTCAVSPDGRRLVTIADDGTATAWDVDTGLPGPALAGEPAFPAGVPRNRQVTDRSRGLTGHLVRSCVFAPDGSWVAVPGSSTTVRLWEPATGGMRAVLDAGPDTVLAYAVAPDGTWVAGACEDGTVRLWETATGEWLASFTGHSGPATACVASPDGRRLVTGGEDHMVRVWDVASLEQRAELAGHTDAVLGCAFGVGGAWFASTGSDHTTRIWDAASGVCAAVLVGHTHTVRAASASPDGSWLATAGGDGTVRVWATDTWGCVAAMRFDGAARDCCWLPDSRGLAVVGAGGVYLYSLVLP